MKRLLRLLPPLLLLCARPALAEDADIVAIRRADDVRMAATIAADRAQLGAILSDDFTYGHSTGRLDTKASFTDGLVSRELRYLSFRYEQRSFTVAGPGVVLMKGRCHIVSVSNGKSVDNHLGFLAVWRKENGAWRFLAWQSCHLPPAEVSKEAPPAPGAEHTLLFFDDEPLYTRDHVTRGLGRPKRVGAYHETAGNCAWAYPCVFRLAEHSWRMVYQAGVGQQKRGGGVILVADSADGIDWHPHDTTGEIDLNPRVAPHQIVPYAGAMELSGAFEDTRASGGERFKMMTVVSKEGAASLWTSPDLIHWTRHPEAVWQVNAPDPPTFAFWNSQRGCYALTTRPETGDRRICLIQTQDWKTFTRPELVLQADAEDPALAQLYGMSVIPYEGYQVGFLWLYHAGDASGVTAPHRYLGGRVDTCLAYSLNGSAWQRCGHRPLFGNGAPGSPDAGCLEVSSAIRLADGTLRCYASCSTREHGQCPPEDGYVVTYDLRRDGFVDLEAGAEAGVVGTRALFWKGGGLSLNADAAGGEMRVRVVTAHNEPVPGFGFDDCAAFGGDQTDWSPAWAHGRTIDELAGRMIRIEVRMRNAKLYAIRGHFVLSRIAEVRRFEKDRIAPLSDPEF